MSAVLALALAVAAPAATADCAALAAEAESIARMNRSDAAAGVDAARAGRVRAAAAGCVAAEAEMAAALGDNLGVAGAQAEAVAAYRDAQALLGPLGESAALASALRREGIAHAGLGDYTTAVERTLEALRISEALGDVNETAMTAGNLATLYSRLGDFQRAREHFERAHAGFIESDNRVSAAGTGINLGSLLMRQADRVAVDDADRARTLREAALSHNLSALAQFEALEHPRGIAMAASNAGVAHALLGDPAAALPLHERALALRQRIGDVDGLVADHIHLADAFAETGRFDDAETHLDRASGLVADRSLALQLSVADQWVALEELRGRPGEALTRLREANRIREAMVADDHASRVAEIQARYDSAQQQRQIDALQHAQALSAATVERQRALLVGGGAGVVLLGLLLAVTLGWGRARRRHSEALARAARTDELTGVANRRDARERIDYEIRRSRRSGRPFSVALVDLDGFKAINDAHGHAAGDHVLVAAARRIQGAVRRQDTLARWGGDEFMLLLPETSERGAATVARKLAGLFAAEPFIAAGVEHSLTLTIGVSQYWPGSTGENVVSAADDAMYRGKRGGRNSVVTAHA